MAKGWSDKRPMSPHISIWKWHPTMASSILHRASGIVLYFGLIKLCIFLAALAVGPKWFSLVEPYVYSPLGAIGFFLLTGVLLYHLLNGIRHLVWDMGKGFDPHSANLVSLLTILVSALGAAGLTYTMVGAIAGAMS